VCERVSLNIPESLFSLSLTHTHVYVCESLLPYQSLFFSFFILDLHRRLCRSSIKKRKKGQETLGIALALRLTNHFTSTSLMIYIYTSIFFFFFHVCDLRVWVFSLRCIYIEKGEISSPFSLASQKRTIERECIVLFCGAWKRVYRSLLRGYVSLFQSNVTCMSLSWLIHVSWLKVSLFQSSSWLIHVIDWKWDSFNLVRDSYMSLIESESLSI